MHANLSSELQLLRVRIEAFASGPAVIMVTSARVGDGKSLTAWSLADSLAGAGHATVLVDANTDAPRTTGAARVRDLHRFPGENIAEYARPYGPNGLSVISLSQPEVATTSSRQTVRQLTTQLRKRFDFAIVDTGALPKNNVALLMAAAADGVLVTVRTGRAATKEDLVLVRTLQQTNRRILGVVLTSKETIDLFELIAKGYDKNVVALAPSSTSPATQASRQAMAHSGK